MVSTEAEERASRLLAVLAEVFERVGLRAVLIGGQAANFWKEPRFTHDVDFTASADPNAFAGLVDAMTAAGFRLRRNQAKDAPSGPDFVQFVHSETDEIVEIQAAKTEFQDEVVRRGIALDSSQPFAVATVEDLIVMKLIAGRSIDQYDNIDLIRIPGLDWDYIHHWAEVWQVGDRLEALRRLVENGRPGI